MTRFSTRWIAALALVLLFGHGKADAAVIISFQEVGADVVATGTGTIDLTALTFNSTMTINPGVSPSGRYFAVGSSASIDFFGGTSGPTSFGPGGFQLASSGSGDLLGISVGFVAVPHGYTSGTALSGSATFSGQTFASLGLNPGTYAFTWGSGMTADSLTVDVRPAAPIPEPGVFSLLGTAGLALGYARRRRRSRLL